MRDATQWSLTQIKPLPHTKTLATDVVKIASLSFRRHHPHRHCPPATRPRQRRCCSIIAATTTAAAATTTATTKRHKWQIPQRWWTRLALSIAPSEDGHPWSMSIHTVFVEIGPARLLPLDHQQQRWTLCSGQGHQSHDTPGPRFGEALAGLVRASREDSRWYRPNGPDRQAGR